MISLIFDTETTGLVDFAKKPDHPSQPHVVQLGMQLTDDSKREILVQVGILVRAEKMSEPKALEVHNRTPELLDAVGVSPKIACELFLQLADKANRLVAHNLDFDSRMMQCECARLNLDYPIGKDGFCTMKDATGHQGTHAGGRTKWPKLIELYKEMVDSKGFSGAHDALVDVNACRQVLWALIDEQDDKVTNADKIKEAFADADESADKKPYDVEELIRTSEKAWFISVDGETIWVPKSQCDFDQDDMIIMIPNWLAKDKGIYEE